MKLEKVVINDYKNVFHKELELGGESIIIEGRNMSGKTNTLNAIYWCLTGVDLTGSEEMRSVFPIVEKEIAVPIISVELVCDTFTIKRECAIDNKGAPSTTIYFNGENTTTKKIGEALLHSALGLTNYIITQPKGFDIVRFLLDPLYFDTVSPSALRKFFYSLSEVDFKEIAQKQNKTVGAMLEKRKILDPYKLVDAIAKDKKAVKKDIDGCKAARALFPEIEKKSLDKEKELTKTFTLLENEEALASRYALEVSEHLNRFYKKKMDVEVCLLEKGVGDDVYKDVCYPILPKSKLPFDAGSQAEKTYVGIKFIKTFCERFNVKPLPILIDNMESLDENTTAYVNKLGVQYIGAMVK